MARKGRDDEQVTDANLEKIISCMELNKPMTKKAACELLRISYNTSRLDSLIDNYKRRKQVEQEQRAKKKYKPASQDEIIAIITGCLDGEPVSTIAKGLYRSEAFVNRVIEKTGCPKRHPGNSYFSPDILPDSCVSETFKVGERVFSSRYDSVATIREETKPGVFKIWLDDEGWQQFAYQPWWELGSLKHLETFGVKI